MKQKLLNKLWLRVGMIVAIMTTALSGTVWAEVLTYKLTIDASDFNTTSYAANNSEKTSKAVCTTDNTKTYEVKWTSNQVMKNGSNMQWQKNNGYIFNSTDLGTITNVTVTNSAGTFTTYYGTSVQPSSGTTVGGGFFQTKVGGATGTTSKIEVTFEVSALNPNDLNLSSSTLSFDLGGTTTSQLTNSGQADGTITWTSSNPAVATVDNSGNVTAVEIGTAVITATQAASSTYQGGTATCTVTVVDSRYTISDLTFTAKCNGSGTADDGAVWTVTSDASESTFDSNSGIHYGTSSATVTYLQLTTSNIMGTIAKVVVNTYDAQACAAVSVTVGGNNFLCGGATTATATDASKDYVFAGTGEGQIVVRIERNEAMKKAIYVKSVKVYYTPSTDPVINATDPAELAYDATSGEFDYSITNPTSATLSATSNNDWITNVAVDGANSKVTFNTTANSNTTQRTGTITLAYTGAPDKVVTITQAAAPVTYTTIPALFDAATSTETNVNVTFGGWVVSGVHGSNVFVTDNSGNGFIIYKSENGFAVNDKLSGTVSGTPLKLYNGFAEFTNLTSSTSGLTVTNDGEITVITNKTIAELGGVNTGAVIKLNNLTYDGTNLSDGTNTIKPYNSLYSDMSLTSGKSYNITGIYQQYNSTKEILPRSAADIVEVVDEREDAEIAFSVETLTFTEGDTYTAPTFSNPNNVTVSFETTDSDVASWNNGLVLGGSTGTATITATFDGDASYKPAAATLVVTINEDLGFATVKVGSGVYQKITSTSELEAGKRYLIVYWDGTSDDAEVFGGVTSSNIGARVTLSIAENKINNNVADAATPVVLQNAGSSNWYIMDGDKFLYWSSGNNLYSSSEVSQTGNSWTIDETSIQNANTTARYLQYNTGSPRFACYTHTQKDVVLYKELPVTLNGYGYATFSSNYAVSIPADGAFTAWQITNIDSDNKITFVQVTGNVMAETGLFLKGDASDKITIEVAASGEELTDNKLVGFPNATNVADGEYYGLSGNQFVKVTAGTVKAGKALLPAGYITESNSVKPFTFVFEDDATGISDLNDSKDLKDSKVIYNLAGQMVNGKSVNGKLPKGIYIVNGKKIMVK